jgi:antitoxin PrlF
LDAKARIVVPMAVRQALGLKLGDTLAFVIDGNDVRIVRAALDPFASFNEWASEVDRKGYGNL